MHSDAGQATYREDYDLAVAMQSGDEAALLDFTRKHENFVYRWAKSRLRDHRDAQDITNKIFSELWHYLIPRWDSKYGCFTAYFKKFAGWYIGNEAKRVRIASIRRSEVRVDVDVPLAVDTTTPHDVLIADMKGEAISQAINKALVKVKVKDKRVKMRCWKLRNEKGLSGREIANLTGFPIKKVAWFIRDINLKLRDLLDYDALINLEV